MNLGSWKIDDLLTFTCNTHNATTGAATDADSAPSYRVYEDETSTPLLTGTMALLDGSNTAGFYSEQITLSAANGFEKGKSYNIYISATVNSVTGTTARFFQMEAEVDANVVSDKTGYALTSAYDPAKTAATQTSVDDLPTNAELATALGTADDATLAAIAALNNLSTAQVNAEVDTALADVGLTTTITGRIDAAVSTRATPAQVNAEVVDALTVDVIADSVAADGTRPTIAQALLMISRFLFEKSTGGTTTVTVKKEDGSTSSMTFTLDDADAPTSITRAT